MNAFDEIQDLLAKTAMRDQVAFENLYEITSPKMYGLAMKMLKRRDWADEVLQEAFVKIWYNAEQYHHQKGSAINWMLSILRYRAIDMLRAQSKFDEAILEADALENISVDRNKGKAFDTDLDECLDELQEKQKNSLLLAFYEGYTHQELSRRLSVPLGTMKSWIRRSLEKLRSCLDEIY